VQASSGLAKSRKASDSKLDYSDITVCDQCPSLRATRAVPYPELSLRSACCYCCYSRASPQRVVHEWFCRISSVACGSSLKLRPCGFLSLPDDTGPQLPVSAASLSALFIILIAPCFVQYNYFY
jgi:hypothetical protein